MDNLEQNTKKYIMGILMSTPLVVTIEQLRKDYKNTIGEPIPYQKLGYNSLEHFLSSIKDTVEVKGSGATAQILPVVSEKVAHINNLVTNQRINKPRKGRHFSHKRFASSNLSYKRSSVQPRKIHYPVVNDFPTSSKLSSQSSNSFEYMTYNSFSRPETSDIKNVKLMSTSSSVSDSNSLNDKIDAYLHSSVPSAKNFEENKFKDIQDLKHNQKLEEKFEDNIGGSKCTNVKNLLKKVSPDKNKYLYQQESRIPSHILNNLKSLINQYPEGIWCAEVPNTYRKMFRQELNYQELGYRSLIDLFVCLPSIFHYVRPSTEDFKLYDRSRPLPDSAEKKFTVASYRVNKMGFVDAEAGGALPNLDWKDVSTFFPDDIFKPGEEIPRAFVSPDLQANDNIDIVVGEIYDLSKFWIYLQDSPLDQLMDDMQEFYKDHAPEYKIPDDFIREGLYCVQVIFGEYHRALIVDVMPEVEDTIRVIFIDYGTMTKVSMKGLCFLHMQFATIPAQAIRCRLANVFPTEEGVPWSKEASKVFRKLVLDRDISAKISNINWEDQFLEVYLADVTDENNIFYINDKLVEEGVAQYTNKDWKQSIVHPIYTPIVKFIHIFPTFLELEHGLAPSTSEMEVFYDCNIPINFCYPQYFYIDYTFEQEIIKLAEDFHERNCAKMKRRARTRYFESEHIKVEEPDLSIFGELKSEIVAFLNKLAGQDGTQSSDEDFVDAVEEFVNMDKSHCSDVDAMAEQRKELSNQEENTVNVLKRDLLVTEDIMKDINLICKLESTSFVEYDCSEDVRSDVDLFNEGRIERQLWTINESRESIDTLSSSIMLSDPPGKTDRNLGNSEMMLFEHPLSKMSFDNYFLTDDELSSSHSPRSEHSSDAQIDDLAMPNFRLKPVSSEDGENVSCNFPLSDSPSGNSFKSILPYSKASTVNRSDGSIQSDCHELISKSNSSSPTDSSKKIESNNFSSTNPFLCDLNENSTDNIDLSLSNLRLNPNNPFLTFLVNKSGNNSDSSQDSTASTVYESPIVQVQVTHSWSQFEDMSPEVISKLGRTLASKSTSTSSNSLVLDDRQDCSSVTQTPNEQTRAIQPVQNQSYAKYNQPQQAAYGYGYAHWSLGYANPYYSLRYGNQSGYTCQAVYGQPNRPPLPPGFGPPPGFPPLGPPAMTGYGNPSSYNSGGQFFSQPNPYRPDLQANFGLQPRPGPPMNPYGSQPRPEYSMPLVAQQLYYGALSSIAAPSAQLNANPSNQPMSSGSATVTNGNKDFYDHYNELLKVHLDNGNG